MSDSHRYEEPPEELLEGEMRGWKAECKRCTEGIVKMPRNLNDIKELQPERCYCLYCGQQYFMKIKDLEKFKARQWLTKED